MTEFWKSGERHFCTFCKCWLAGNKISIDLHESGNHHKSNVKAKLDLLRKNSLEKERQDKQLSQTLGKMERAANESFRRDMASTTINGSNYNQANNSTTTDPNLPSKLKRPLNQPVQVQCKKPKFVIKTPTPKPVYEAIETPTDEVKTPEQQPEAKPTSTNHDKKGTWYESKTETQESFYWNDVTGASTWTPPDVYLSIEEQRAKGLKV
ncbi:unnamed protein product [Rotaria socialis]|uniref:WW domain-containing protein n=1 Tax=Rotaria socialis TaxID=392032 RepID=A0A817R3N7_9BILA|nr:unnamed protein product [Rotaria socialis]CAF3316353.1 unnamed protein product [Rotaria socialis]CAF3390983.1 unnamed protein product [Rotaria socialis]CAF3395576.1 unnamed protein product [Rotaria socialis]CAF4257766.1 unnamed protein product [Rotaria socialis]